MISPQLAHTQAENEGLLARHGSPLELLHPAGHAPRAVVIGSNCPDSFRLAPAAGLPSQADLLVLAPTAEECRRDGWLEDAIRAMATVLAPDGVGYLLVPRRWRFRSIRLCLQYGLLHDLSVAHVPDWKTSRYLIPLVPASLHYAASVILVSSWRRYLLKLGLRGPGIPQLLSLMRPSNGLVFRRPGTRPLFEWLFQLDGGARPGHVVIHRSWRGHAGATVLYRFGRRETVPSAIVKAISASGSPRSGVAEGAVLPRLAPDARRAGVQVPEVLFTGRIGPWVLLSETVVAGRRVAEVLNEHSDQLPIVLEQVGNWLERWHQLTAVAAPVTAQQLDEMILAPAARLAPLLEGGDAYTSWLAQQCGAVAGTAFSFVATHNDLTMLNVLLDSKGKLGVIDWETASETGLPLVDLFYAVVDAVAATEGYADRLSAFHACFAPEGGHAAIVSRLQQRLAQSIKVSPSLANLCFHACWLHHATNECRAEPSTDETPFLDIVRWLALHQAVL